MLRYLILFGIAGGGTWILTPIVRKLAIKCGAIDVPDERKVHTVPVPRLGGVAIYVVFFVVLIIASQISYFRFSSDFLNRPDSWQFWLASTLVFGVGVFDDLRKLSPGVKLAFQALAAAIIAITMPWASIATPFGSFNLGVFSIPLTLVWIIGLTNAINLLDGLDGLAGGASFIACFSFFGISLLNGNLDMALVAAILGGALVGFLRYNFYPAKIFLGDSGAYFLGFSLSVLSLRGSLKGTAAIAILVPLLVLGLPLMDTFLAMLRRTLSSLHILDYDGEKNQLRFLFRKGPGIFRADRNHIHHRLLQLGFTQKNAVILLYVVSGVLGLLAFSLTYFQSINHGVFLTVVAIATVLSLQKLGYKEIRIFSNGRLLPLIDATFQRNKFLLGFIDFAFIAISYYLAFILRFGKGFLPFYKDYFLKTLPVVLAVKMLVFYFDGLYKKNWRQADIGDFVKIVRAVFFGSALSVFLMWIIPGYVVLSLSLFAIDFMVLAFVIFLSRSSFRVLEYFHLSETEGKKRALIYGPEIAGIIASKEIHHLRPELIPIGFVSDDVRQVGRSVSGIPVLGTLESLADILGKKGVQEVVIAREDADPEKIQKITQACAEAKVPVRRFQISVRDLSPGLGLPLEKTG
jgi:UDP-GlcNAc:undecaprenyl-phosphate GlcNAc-1-phosphate transferase